jgi:hypothetical protein
MVRLKRRRATSNGSFSLTRIVVITKIFQILQPAGVQEDRA